MRWLLAALLALCFSSAQANVPPYSTPVQQVRTLYSSTNVTTSVWVELVHALPYAITMIEVFDSSGQTLELGTGASGHEVPIFILFPGGNGQVFQAWPVGTRIVIKALSGTAASGENDLNFYN